MVSQNQSLATSEKRLEERVAARVSVQLFQENNILLREYSVNLSVGGIFLEAEKLLAEGTPLVLHFELPDSRHIHCQARVAWVNTPQSLICQDLPAGHGNPICGSLSRGYGGSPRIRQKKVDFSVLVIS